MQYEAAIVNWLKLFFQFYYMIAIIYIIDKVNRHGLSTIKPTKM